MTRTNFFLPDDMIERLRQAKEKTGMPVSEFVRRAIESALKKAGL